MNPVLIDEDLIKGLIRPRSPEGHKGTFGHALIMAGSAGKTGSAILCAKAALRSGCGLVSVYIHSSAYTPLLAQLPEAMIIPRKKKDREPPLGNFSAIGFGPGIGVDNQGIQLLVSLLKNDKRPLVIDADGITLLSQHRKNYQHLHPGIILTPHPVEFDRLTKMHHSAEERLESQISFSKRYQVIIVLKGHRTTVSFPDGKLYQNTTGNSGMATAGSGDVLTGIITLLCSQGYAPEKASLAGVYLHGYAGDAAAAAISKTSMISGDIVDFLRDFFRQYEI